MSLLNDAKTLLAVSGAPHDTVLQGMIDGILEEADEYMQVRYTANPAVVEYHDGGEAALYLGHVNPSDVTVEVDGTALEADEFTVYPSGRIRLVSGRFPRGNRIVKVSYAGGYDDEDMPRGLRNKLLKQVAYEFRRRNDPGLSAVTAPDGTVSKFSIVEWLPDVEAVLQRHRRIIL